MSGRDSLQKFVSDVERDASREMLIDIRTGELWDVDAGELRGRGMPGPHWCLYSDVEKTDLLFALQKAKGINVDVEKSDV